LFLLTKKGNERRVAKKKGPKREQQKEATKIKRKRTLADRKKSKRHQWHGGEQLGKNSGKWKGRFKNESRKKGVQLPPRGDPKEKK